MPAYLEPSRYKPVSSLGKSKLSASAAPFISSRVKCEGNMDAKITLPSSGTVGSSSKMQPECCSDGQGSSERYPEENWLYNAPTGLARIGEGSCVEEELNLPRSEMPAGSKKDDIAGSFNQSLTPLPGSKVVQSEEINDAKMSEDPSELFTKSDKKEESSCFCLMLEEFPLLPGCKKEIQPVKYTAVAGNVGQDTKLLDEKEDTSFVSKCFKN
ncbi:OLC1v1026960C1 [Oldenlandia corymbosa var. corymbosa]|uniref:OLC1v1026960C1 n=1 Tax=Oldenlandia corymbosa var. corymbosa TaxID=529605 RepID=A0AAV1CBC7_OLDCO|nr:OLC1v1026960C1 [Oldenlandia corymbosa var. corymbosa]